MANLGNIQLEQIVTDDNLKSLGSVAREDLKTVLARIEKELESPLRLHATFPAADSKLNFSLAPVILADGAKKALPPVKSQVHTLVASTIDFQTQATTGATFIISWPSNTVGQFRRAGFTLLGDGTIQVLFSAEAATQGALANPGTLFVKSGVALGYIDLEATSSSAFKTAGSTSNLIENAQVYRFSAGSGGGSGTGDADSFTSQMELRLLDSFFAYGNAVPFSKYEATKTSSTTGSFDLVDSVYLLGSGQHVTSVQLFGSEFLANSDDSMSLEVHTEFLDSGSIDLNATTQVAIDGSTYQTVTMARHGLTQRLIGRVTMNEPSNTTQYSVAAGANTELTAANSITRTINVTDKTAIRGINVYITKTGSPSGSYIVSLKDASGNILYSKIALVSTLSAGANTIALTGFKSVLPAGTYDLVFETDATYKASYVASTTAISVNAQYELLGYKYDLRFKLTSSASGRKLKAFCVFYDEQVSGAIEGSLAQDRKVFSGDLNTTTFVMTKFLPDPYKLKVYDITSGQVYRYGAFTVDAYSVVFPSGTFAVPGATINLLFDQSEGTGYNATPVFAALAAANGLGSMDNAIDLSVAGIGPIVKNAAGKRRMITLDADDNIEIKELE